MNRRRVVLQILIGLLLIALALRLRGRAREHAVRATA